MHKKVIALVACALMAAPLAGCAHKAATFNPTLAGDFFPLTTNAVWTYRIASKSQRSNYVITDKVIGEKYVPSLNVTGEVVEEYYDMQRGGPRPIVYVTKNGYLTRLSGLDYSKKDIEAPVWGRSEEGSFIPLRLTPNLIWSSKIFPFGHMSGAFDISQTHRSYLEDEDVVVPAGHFAGCIRIETRAVYEGGSYAKIGKTLRLTYEDWYAPNVGLVKTVAVEGAPGGPEMERVELIRYIPPTNKASAPAKTASAAG